MVKGMDIEKKVIKMLEALLKTDLLRDCTCEPDIQVMMPDA